ncbi:MAG: CBS domain-containing protein [Silicimonas sp.]|nr:CBS domain-containing protein [Silicimonas sp.]NNF91044.1 CBS domain-containing protein [Boseongicola sp.]RZW12427.1 MAG: CBS domain-containing protein [Paracoccaceae bacterium]NND18618.1 CBS domain-containing protein [Silicimonas sp.]NND21791.1 CBS domain-containing protein [Silicimonas sp.]
MLVRQILAMKGGGDVVTIDPDASVKDAVRMLSEKRIGAVLVGDGKGAPDGILSERDVVREIGRRGDACLNDKVADMMTRDLVSSAPDDTADVVLSRMTEGRFRHMPVMEKDALVGVISIGDVVKARLSELSMEKDALEGMIKGF